MWAFISLHQQSSPTSGCSATMGYWFLNRNLSNGIEKSNYLPLETLTCTASALCSLRTSLALQIHLLLGNSTQNAGVLWWSCFS